MTEDYNGQDVVDPSGNKIGTVEQTFVNDAGTVRMIEVKIGTLLAKHRLIPTDQAQPGNGEIAVPFSKDIVEASPDVRKLGDEISSDTFDEVRSYYLGSNLEPLEASSQGTTEARSDSEQAAAPGQDSGLQYGEARDAGDVIEIPIYEERLVKQRVVREVLRVKKSKVAETHPVSGDVRSEDVVVDDSRVSSPEETPTG